MTNYIDGFVFPIQSQHLQKYKEVAQSVATIWREHGALSYSEFVGDDLVMDGVRSFAEMTNATNDEVIIFGWVSFSSKESRDIIHEKIAIDPRMNDLIAPLVDPSKIIFNSNRMAFAGFKPIIQI